MSSKNFTNVHHTIVYYLSHLLTGAFAGGLFYYATREQAGKQKLVEEKLRVIADMNHHIRNALQG